MHIYVPALVSLQLRVQLGAARLVYMCTVVTIHACGIMASRHYSDTRCMKRPRRLGPGANAPTRREPGGSHAQTALTDTPPIYTSQGVCNITGRLTPCSAPLPLLLPAPPSRASTDTHVPAAALSCRRQAMLVSSRIGRRRRTSSLSRQDSDVRDARSSLEGGEARCRAVA